MKQAMKRLLALTMALLLALPTFALAEEDYTAPVEDWVAEQIVELGGDPEPEPSQETVSDAPQDSATDAVDAPATDAADAPTTEQADAPTTEQADAPTTEQADAPATDAADAPTTEQADAPTTEQADAPTTDAADAPATEQANAPTTDAADAPTTEQADAPTTDAPTTEQADAPATEQADAPTTDVADAPDAEADLPAEPDGEADIEGEAQTEARGYAVVRFIATPENASIEVYPAGTDEVISPMEDGAWWLEPGEYEYSAWGEACLALERAAFTVAEGDEALEIPFTLESAPVAFEQTRTVDGVAVTVTAEAGAFPANSTLYVAKAPVAQQIGADAAVEDAREADQNVAVSYTFDIQVQDEYGNELQPAEGYTVSVSFALAEVADENLTASVYHVTEDADGALTADKLEEVEVDAAEETVTAQTDGFSIYTVEFTYNTLQYVLEGGASVALSEILCAVGLTGEVEGATVSDEALFSVSDETGEWMLASHRPFTSEEWLKVVVGGVEYEIAVTDDNTAVEVSYKKGGDTPTVQAYPISSETGALTGEWFYVDGNVELTHRLNIQRDVSLILCDGATLNAPMGIRLAKGNSLTIYGQAGDSGKLIATANADDYGYAGIGGNEQESGGAFTLYGGHVTAQGAADSAGIGGGDSGCGGVVTVYGGTLTATGGEGGAGIGGGLGGSQGGNISIYGGTVTATGGDYAAGVGGGQNFSDEFGNEEFGGNGGNVYVYGGTLTATGGIRAAGVGGGQFGNGGTLSVANQCTVTATAGAKSSRDAKGIPAIGRGEFSTEREADQPKQTEGSVVLSDEATVKAGDSAATAPNEPYTGSSRAAACRKPYAQITSEPSPAHAIDAQVNQLHEDSVTDTIEVQDADGHPINQAKGGTDFKVVLTLAEDSVFDSITATYTSGGQQKTLATGEPTISGNTCTYTYTMPSDVDKDAAVRVVAVVRAVEYDITIGEVTPSAAYGTVTLFKNDQEAGGYSTAMQGERVWIRAAANEVNYPDWFLQGLVVKGETSETVYAKLENDVKTNIAMGADESTWSFIMPKEAVVITATFAEGCHYIALDGNRKVRRYVTSLSGSPDSLTLNGSGTAAGWYAVKGNLTVTNRVDITAEVNIILCDGAKLTANDGIFVAKRCNARLTIWAQTGGSGEIYAKTDSHWAGIGGNKNDDAGPITINGGKIEAHGGSSAAGIGGGQYCHCDSITISVPKNRENSFTKVKAYGGKYGAGIGAGEDVSNQLVVINGGDVYAEGGDYGAGIGGGEGGGNEKTIINGGIVRAYGGKNAAGIGGGEVQGGGGYGGVVEVHGGDVYAKGDKEAAGIGGGGDGGGGANFTIDGGKVEAVSGGDISTAIGGGHDCKTEGTASIADHMKVTGDRIATTGEREAACRYWKKVVIEACTHDGRKPVPVDYTNHQLDSCQYCKLGGALRPHVWGLKTSTQIADGQCTECGLVRYRSITVNDAQNIEAQLCAGSQALATKRDGEGGASIWSGIYLDRHDRAITVKVRPVDGYLLTGEYTAFYMQSGNQVNITLSELPEADGWRVYTFTMPENGEVNLSFTAQPVQTNVRVNITKPEGVSSAGSVRLRNESGAYLERETDGRYVISGRQTITATVHVKSGYVMDSDSFTVTDAVSGAAYAFTKTALNTYQFYVDGSDLNINVTFIEGKRGVVYHVLQQIDEDGNLCWPNTPGDPLSRKVAGTYVIPNNPANEAVPKGESGYDYIICGYCRENYSEDDYAYPVNPGTDPGSGYTNVAVSFNSDNEALYVYYKREEQRLRIKYYNATQADTTLYVPFGMPVKKYLDKNDKKPTDYGYDSGCVWAWLNEEGKLVRLTDSKTMPAEKYNADTGSREPALVLEANENVGKAIVCLNLGGYDKYQGDTELWPNAISGKSYPYDAEGIEMDQNQARAFVVDLGEPLPAKALAAMYGVHTPGYKLEGWYEEYGDVLWDADRPVTEDECVKVKVDGVSTNVCKLKAKWVLRDAIIEYNPAGNGWLGGVPEPTPVTANETVNLADGPETKPGWYTRYWKSPDESTYSPGSSFYYGNLDVVRLDDRVNTPDPDAKNIIRMTAVYVELVKPYSMYFHKTEGDTHKITLTVKGGEVEKPFTVYVDGNKTRVYNHNIGQEIQISNYPIDNPTQEGYTFLGWSETKDGVAKKRINLNIEWGGKYPKAANLYACWEVNRHTLTLDENGGRWPEGTFIQTGYDYGEAIDWDSLVPVRDHYVFKGWKITRTDDGSEVTERPATMPDYNLTAKAQWEQRTYTMTFMNVGAEYKKYEEYFGVQFDKPADPPAREGYTFSGWQPDLPEGQQLTMPDYDMVYTARWLKETDTPDAPVAQAVSRTALEIVNPVKGQMYRIYRDGDAGTPWREADGRSVAFDSLTPGMTYNVVTYMPGEPGVTADSPVSAATRVTLPRAVAVRLDLGAFDPLADDEAALRGEYWPDWPQRSYEDPKAYFYAEDMTIPRSFMVDEGAALDADVIDLINSAWSDGHKRTGWQARNGRTWDANTFTASAAFFDAGNGGQRVATAVSDEGLSYPYYFITLQAQWVLLPARVEFNLMGGHWNPNEDPSKIILQPGDKPKLPTVKPVADQWDGKLWQFTGWEDAQYFYDRIPEHLHAPGTTLTTPYENLKDYFIGDMGVSSGIEEDEEDNYNIIYMIAHYEMLPEVKPITVNFVTDIGNNTRLEAFTTKIPEGEASATVTLSDFYESTAEGYEGYEAFSVSSGDDIKEYYYYQLQKTGHVFTGWYMKGENDSEIPVDGPIVFNRDGLHEATLYAKYEPIWCTIIFDSKGGTPVQEITQAYDTPVQKPADPVKAHHTFKGWKIANQSEQNPEGVNVDNGGHVEWPHTMLDWVTGLFLEADWTPIQYTITLTTNAGEGGWPSGNDGSSSLVSEQKITGPYGSPVIPPENPTRDNYVFNGWKKASDTTGALVPLPKTMPDTNPTYVADWLNVPNQPGAPVVTATTRNSLTVGTVSGQKYIVVPESANNPTADTEGWKEPEDGQTTLPYDGLIPGATYKVYTYKPAETGTTDSPISTPTVVTLPNEVRVVFDLQQDASADLQPIICDEGQSLPNGTWTEMKAATRLGYRLAGWKNNSGEVTWSETQAITLSACDKGENNQPKLTPVMDDQEQVKYYSYYTLTLKADWALLSAQVKYDLNGGKWPMGEGPAEPVIQPGKTGTVTSVVPVNDTDGKMWEFVAWRFGKNMTYAPGATIPGDNAYDDPSEVSERAAQGKNLIKLVATYKLADDIECVLTFDSNDGRKRQVQADVTILAGEPKLEVGLKLDGGKTVITGGSIENPIRGGYTLKGWSLSPNSVSTVEMLTLTRTAPNRTLYAVWQRNEHTLTVNGLGPDGDESKPIDVEYGEALSKRVVQKKLEKIGVDIEREYYTFDDWQGLPQTMPDEDVAVTALWKPVVYTVTLKYNDGYTPNYTASAIHNAKSPVVYPDEPTRRNYVFMGWKDSRTGQVIAHADLPDNLGEKWFGNRKTYVAQWTLRRYTLSFDTAGGSAVEPIVDVYGASITPPADPTRAHFEFVRWEPAVPASMPDSDMTVQAVWRPISYSVVFMDGDAEYGRIVDVFGAKLTPPPEPVRDGLAFKGWSDRASGKSAVRLPGTMPDDNPVYYAIWGPPKDDGPAAQKPVLVGRTANTLTIETKPGEEYSIDGGKTWQTGDTFTGLSPATPYSIVARAAETATTFAGPASEPLIAATDKAAGARAQKPVLVGRTPDSLTIQARPGEEYSIDGGKTWQTGDTFAGLTPGTQYEIVARVAETATAYAGPASEPLIATTDKRPQGPVENLSSDPSSSQSAKDGRIRGVTPGMEYSPDNGQTWIPVAGETVEGLTPGEYLVRWAETATHHAGPAVAQTVYGTALDVSAMLIATMCSVRDDALNATWTRVEGVDGYDVFFVNCGNYDFQLVGTVPASAPRSFDFTGLEKKHCYKVIVRAWIGSADNRQYVAESPVAHCYTTGGAGKLVNPASITLKKADLTVRLGKTRKISAGVKGVRKGSVLAHDHKLRYISDNPAVATVSKLGKVRAVGPGSCTIYVLTSNGIWTTVAVTVDDSPTKVKLKGAKRTMAVGEAQALGGCVKLYAEGARTTLAWTSSDPAVAAVDADGNVTALSKGTATITVATHNGKKAKVRIKVK